MSHHSEDNFTSACSDSFWEPGNYKRTTKRIEDGNKLCGDLMSLIGERAEIERNYAKQLKAWANKWNTIIEKGKDFTQPCFNGRAASPIFNALWRMVANLFFKLGPVAQKGTDLFMKEEKK